MNHPPIPPNCPYFQTYVMMKPEVTYFEVDHEEPENCIALNVQSREDPRYFIIVAVARCAWLDEAEKRHYAVRRDTDERGGIRVDLVDAWDEALKNADAWAKWGASK